MKRIILPLVPLLLAATAHATDGSLNYDIGLEQNQEKVMGQFKSRTEVIDEFKASSQEDSVNSEQYEIKGSTFSEGRSNIDGDFVIRNESASTGLCQEGVNDGATRSNGGILEECLAGQWIEMDVGMGGGANTCAVMFRSENGKVAIIDYTSSRSGENLGFLYSKRYNQINHLYSNGNKLKSTYTSSFNTPSGTFTIYSSWKTIEFINKKMYLPAQAQGSHISFGLSPSLKICGWNGTSTTTYSKSYVKCSINALTGKPQLTYIKSTGASSGGRCPTEPG